MNKLQQLDHDCLEETVVNGPLVEAASRRKLHDSVVMRMADFYQALADPTRLRIVHALNHAEMCVCDIAAVLGMSQSSVSHQLRYLKQLALIKPRKAGRMVYYSIDDEHVHTLFETGLEHVTHLYKEA